eukprot:gene12538-16816_t
MDNISFGNDTDALDEVIAQLDQKSKYKSKTVPTKSSNGNSNKIYLKSMSQSQIANETEEDTSFIIDTTSAQIATCPNCLKEVDSKKLRIHMTKLCTNKEIICPEPGCGTRLNVNYLRRHLDSECQVTMKRKKFLLQAQQRRTQQELLLEQEAMRATANSSVVCKTIIKHYFFAIVHVIYHNLPVDTPPPFLTSPSTNDIITDEPPPQIVVCSSCNESMKVSKLSHHQANNCIHRTIFCPNFSSGCPKKNIPLLELQQHLKSSCVVEKHRQEMIIRSQSRQECVTCPLCGNNTIPLMDLKRHESELCENRKVHCRNHALGCHVMVNLKERSLHEHVDGKKYVRNCLYMNGHGTHLHVGEDDIPGKWTAEFWVYRAAAEEAGRGHIRNMLFHLPIYNIAFAAEVSIKTKDLEDSSTGLKGGLVPMGRIQWIAVHRMLNKVSKEEKARIAQESAKRRMDMINELTSLVSIYNNAVLYYTRIMQVIAVELEEAYSCIAEVASRVGFRDNNQEISLN